MVPGLFEIIADVMERGTVEASPRVTTSQLSQCVETALAGLDCFSLFNKV